MCVRVCACVCVCVYVRMCVCMCMCVGVCVPCKHAGSSLCQTHTLLRAPVLCRAGRTRHQRASAVCRCFAFRLPHARSSTSHRRERHVHTPYTHTQRTTHLRQMFVCMVRGSLCVRASVCARVCMHACACTSLCVCVGPAPLHPAGRYPRVLGAWYVHVCILSRPSTRP